MKQAKLHFFLVLIMALSAISATAYDFEVDGIYYNRTSSNTAEVSFASSYHGEPIVIPSTVAFNGQNYIVTAIGDSAFYSSDVSDVTIPETISLIGKDAFMGIYGGFKLTCLATTPPKMEGAFEDLSEFGTGGVPIYDRYYDIWGIAYNYTGPPSPTLYVPSEAYQSYKELNDNYHYFHWIFGIEWEKTAAPTLNYDYSYSLDRTTACNITFERNEECKIIFDCLYRRVGYMSWWQYGYYDNDTVLFLTPVFDDNCFSFIIRCVAIAEGKQPSVIIIGNDEYGFGLCPPFDCDFDFEEAGICYYGGGDGIGDGIVLDDNVRVTSGKYIDPLEWYLNWEDRQHRYVSYSGDIVIPTKVHGCTVDYVYDDTFSGCSDMTSLSLPASCCTSFLNLFGCTGLKRMLLPVGCGFSLGYYDDVNAYVNDCDLNMVYFYGDGILGYYFERPDRVKSLYLGSGVTGIDKLNINPTTIYSYATTPPVCEDLYDEVYEGPFPVYDAELHVPVSSLAAYVTAPYWCNFTNIIGDIVPISDFSLAQDSVDVLKGSQFTLDPIITPANVVPDTIIWQSTNKDVATVKDGVVTAVGIGECEIQAICQGKFVVCCVFVNEILATEVMLDHKNAQMEVGESLQLSATILPANTTNKTIYWSTSNSRIATVNGNGLVTAIAPGTVAVTASTRDGSNLSASCTVVVTDRLSDYDNFLSLNDVEAFHGDTIVIPVAMTNADQIVSFQTDILIPEGLELVQEDGEYLIEPSDRMTRTHSIMSNDVSSGAIRVMCYSSNYKPFTGNSGDDLFYITVKVTDDAKGDYIIQLKNTLFTTSDFEEIAAPDVAAILNVKAYQSGDVNGSGVVTVTDVVLTAQFVLEQNPQPFIFEAADVNTDGDISVTDVTRIAWMVLNPSQNAPRRAPAMWNNGDCMSAEAITLKSGETRKVSILLDNAMAYTAFQLDLMLPDGLTVGNFQLTDRAGGHAFAVNSLGDGDLRALCYSPALDVISGHQGTLLTFDVTASTTIEGPIVVKDIELVTPDCQTALLDGFAIGVNSTTSKSELNGPKVIAYIDYYNLFGQRIERPASGVTLVVITYTDGTRTTSKIIK